MIYLTVIGLSPCDSSTVHFYTQTVHRTTQSTQNKQYTGQHNSLIRKSANRAPSLRVIPWHCLTTEGKARKNLSQGSRRMQVGMMKTEYTEHSIQTIRINKNNNKNT